MADFEKAVLYVLSNEGGFSDDVADRGGATRFGITHAEAAAHGLDVRTLTVEQAKQIYRADYWRFDSIAEQATATKLLDMAVNMGLGTAVKLLQHIVGVVQDGAMGSATANAANSAPNLMGKLIEASVRRYAHIVGADHSQAAFIVGWIDRALRTPA